MMDMKWMDGGVKVTLRSLALYPWNLPPPLILQNDKKINRRGVDPFLVFFVCLFFLSFFGDTHTALEDVFQ